MLQYLIILIDDISLSYCHANNPIKVSRIIPLDTLKKAIVFGMKHNLMIHFVLPPYQLSNDYIDMMNMIDHISIGKDIVVCSSIPTDIYCKHLVLRLTIKNFLNNSSMIMSIIPNVERINICFTDIECFSNKDIEKYSLVLEDISKKLIEELENGKFHQVNILTDRLFLSEMKNCGAGVSNITLAPNGRFYICPAFYYDEQMQIDNMMNYKDIEFDRSVGDLSKGISIPNQHLLSLDYAPLCRKCDSYHCDRCIWLNQKLTWDNNTPSHQQCLMSHIERNASKKLSNVIKEMGCFTGKMKEIRDIDYLDPIDIV